MKFILQLSQKYLLSANVKKETFSTDLPVKIPRKYMHRCAYIPSVSAKHFFFYLDVHLTERKNNLDQVFHLCEMKYPVKQRNCD